MIATLLALLLVQQPPASDAAKKARADLDAVRASIEKMMKMQERGQKIRELYRSANEEECKKLDQERETLTKQFVDVRTSTIKAMDDLIASAGEALKAAPEDPGLLEVRGEAYLIYQKNDLALPDLEKLHKVRPGDQTLTLKLGRLQHALNRYEASAVTLEEYLKKDAKNVEVRVLLAMCAFATAKFEQAVAMFDEILKDELNAEQRSQTAQFQESARKYVPLGKAELEIRAKEAKADDLPRVRMETTKGEIVIELLENEAPNTVANFVELVSKKYYDGLKFHRVIPGFMAQGGDPSGNGSGGPGYRFKDEIPEGYRRHFRGSLSMANAGPDTNGSQFFLTHLPTEWLNGKHTVFGRVITGQSVVDSLMVGDAIVKAEVLRKRDHEYKVVKIEEK